MHFAQRTDRPRGSRLLPSLLALGATLTVSCSSGGDKDDKDDGDGNQPGGQSAFSVEELLGSWLLFTTSDDSSQADAQVDSLDKDLFPVEIARDGSGGFEMRFDSDGISDSVPMRADGDEVVVFGFLDTNDGAVEIDARWEVRDGGDLLSGPLDLVNAVGEPDSLDARAARVDPDFANHPLVGSWEWGLTTLATTCEGDNDPEFVAVDIVHFHDDEFFARLSPGEDASFLLELDIDGELSGRDEDDNFGLRVSNSSLSFGDDVVNGQMTLTAFGDEACESVLAVEGLRDVVGGIFLPTASSFFSWIESPTNSPRIMLVDPDKPSESVDLGLLNSEIEFGFETSDFTGIAYGGQVNIDTGEVTGIAPKALVLLDGKHLELVDLRVSRNSLGDARVPDRVLASIPAIANPSELTVFSDLGDLMAVATVRENNTSLRLFEIREDGSFSTLFMPSGDPLFTAFHPQTGEYVGLIVQDGSVLKRVRPGVTQELSQDANNVLQATDGSIFFREGSTLRGVRWDTNEVITIGQLDGTMQSPVVDGSTLYFIDRVEGDPIILTLKRARIVEGGLEILDIQFVPSGFISGQIIMAPLPSATHVWYSFATQSSEKFRSVDLVTKSAVDVPGDFLVIASRFTLGALMCLTVFNFGEFDDDFKARTYQGNGTGQVAHTSRQWSLAVQDTSFVLGARREPLGILGVTAALGPDSFTMRLLQRSDPTVEAFVGAQFGTFSIAPVSDSRFGVQQRTLAGDSNGNVLLLDLVPNGEILQLTVTGDARPLF